MKKLMCNIYQNDILSHRYYFGMISFFRNFENKLRKLQCSNNDIAGFNMSYQEFQKKLRMKAWNEKYSYLKMHRLDDEGRICFCNESKQDCEIVTPVTDVF